MLELLKPLVTSLVGFCVTILGIATPLVAMWMKNYFAIREIAAMNQIITMAASREGAVLVSKVSDIKTVTLGNPDLTDLALDLMKHHADECAKLGFDLNRVECVILGEAHKIANTSLVPVPSISVVTTTPPGARP